ncbi:MAG: aminopeptidase [Betaproteobacteria bacterium]
MAISASHRSLVAGVALLVALSAAGCSTVGYYVQAIEGQFELVHQARPIPQVIADPATPQALQDKLTHALQIRNFASAQLHLPDNDSYRRYADLKRAYVVWNVFAAPEFSITPKDWCFPFAGCVGYKGYFSKAGADQLAADLAKQGYDVYTGGVPAYSTLGWLNDPILNTFIHYPDAELARLVFHELAHQVAYAKGDSTFNESFAVTVEEVGVERWLASNGTLEQRKEFDAAQIRRHGFVQLVTKYRARLADVYAEPLSPELMRERKRMVQMAMRAEYEQLKKSWNDYAGYDAWIGQSLNNAQFASIAIYTQLVPTFQRILRDNDGDLTRFYAQVKRLAGMNKAERDVDLSKSSSSEAEGRPAH